ncbi:hypothetical protein A2124_02225, partial [Candidatus Woesebacteria bacterium GWB1_37_5]
MTRILSKATKVEIKKLKKQNNYVHELYRWFPVKDTKLFIELYRRIFDNLDLTNSLNRARVRGNSNKEVYASLLSKYSQLPNETVKDEKLILNLAKDFLAGAPIWKSPLLQYNVGSATNIASNVLYAISQEVNVYNINDGLAGNALAAEKVVCRILSLLAGVDPDKSAGIFTFGGTGTNLYAIKVAITKAVPQSKKLGLRGKIKIAITEDSHFSHMTSLNWLGIGEENAIVMQANRDRTTNISRAENEIKSAIENDFLVPAIIVNGGTTYDNAIDNINKFVEMRNKLVKKYELRYVPHVHVDSVIGWSFLVFRDYDFDRNELDIESNTLKILNIQAKKAAAIAMADSWGVDFHKGIGSSPIPCSMVIMNNSDSFATLLQQNEDGSNLHQLAQEFSHINPVSYTLETSRPGGAALAGLTTIFTLGVKGLQAHLANLVQMARLTRVLAHSDANFNIVNTDSLGFVTMLQLIPISLQGSSLVNKQLEDNSPKMAKFIENLNKYNEDFFSF